MSKLAILKDISDEGRKLDNNFINTRTGFPEGDSEIVLLGRVDDSELAERKNAGFTWYGSKLQGLAVAVREKGNKDDNGWAPFEANSFTICKAIPEWKSAQSLKDEMAMDINKRPHYFVNMTISTTKKTARDGTEYYPKEFRRIKSED